MSVENLISADGGCNKPVGAGYINFNCRLPVGHDRNGSPCVAPEVAASIRRYNAWEAEAEVTREAEERDAFRREREGNWTPPERPANEGAVESAFARLSQEQAYADLTEEQKANLQDAVNDWFGGAMGAAVGGVEVETKAEPTKQRPGDQVLPSGGGACVQDRIIADMVESKRVGIERYGQVLRTFNGRKGFQDVFDEVRDLHVYMTMIAMEAEATGDDLVATVEAVLDEWDDSELTSRQVAEQIVDRLGGWVLAHRLGVVGS